MRSEDEGRQAIAKQMLRAETKSNDAQNLNHQISKKARDFSRTFLNLKFKLHVKP